MYADSKNSLKSIVGWLEGTDEAGWESQIKFGEECRSDMERMARPTYERGNRSFEGPGRDPNAPRLNRANPHLRAMLSAMRSRNRAAALEHGKAALAVM